MYHLFSQKVEALGMPDATNARRACLAIDQLDVTGDGTVFWAFGGMRTFGVRA